MTAGVVTGEAVRLDVRLAHWPSRLLAKLIDYVIQGFLLGFALLIVGRIFADSDAALGAAVGVCTLVLVLVGYSVILETLWRGRTIGKAALGLRVVRDDGGPERFRHALVRGFLFPLESWGPALIASIISKRGKRLGDMLAGTIVVQERVPGQTAMPVQMPPPLAWWAASLDLSRFGDDLAMACRQFLARQGELNAMAREEMGGQLVAAVVACTTPPPPPGTPGWAYLSAVLAERRRREEQRTYAGQAVPQVGAAPYAPTPPYGQPPYAQPPSGQPPYGTQPSYGQPPHSAAPPVAPPVHGAGRPVDPGPFAPPE